MRFSTRAEYGLKAVVNLATTYPQTKNVRELSQEEHIPSKYLERILGILRKGGIVESFKGKIGGYVLSKKPSNLRVGEVIEVLDGPIAPMRCVGKFCRMKKQCRSSLVWINLGEQIKANLYSIKLSDLIDQKYEK